MLHLGEDEAAPEFAAVPAKGFETTIIDRTKLLGRWEEEVRRIYSKSPFLDSLYGEPLGDKVYSIKSNIDQIVCATGVCSVGGVHSSRIWNEDASYTYTLGHFGLQTDTASLQVNLIQ